MVELGSKPNIRIGAVIGEQWTVKKKLGEGSCGIVFLLANISNPKVREFEWMLQDSIYFIKSYQGNCKFVD